MGATVIAHGNTPPVLDFGELVFDFVTLFVEFFVVTDTPLTIFAGRDTRSNAFGLQSLPEPICIIAAIGQQRFGLWQFAQQDFCPPVIADLTRR